MRAAARRRGLGGDSGRPCPERSEPMKSDAEIRDDVINELYWDPQVTEPEAIGVAVRGGAVTLTGHVPSYAEKLAAARAAERVYGVKAVANDLKVQLSRAPRDGSDIARAIAHILEWTCRSRRGRCTPGWRTAGHAGRRGGLRLPEARGRADGQPRPRGGRGAELHHRPAAGQPGGRRGRRSSARPRLTRGTSRSRSPTTPRRSTGTCTRCGRRAPRRPPLRGSPPWTATWR